MFAKPIICVALASASLTHASRREFKSVLEGMMSSVRGGDKAALGAALNQMKADITPDSATAIRNIIDPAVEEVTTKITAQAHSTQAELDEIVNNLRRETREGSEAKATADNIDNLWVACVGTERSLLQTLEESIVLREQTRNETQRVCALRDVAAIVKFDPTPNRDEVQISCDFSETDSCPNALAAEQSFYGDVKTTTAATVAQKVEEYINLRDECARLVDLGNQQDEQIAANDQAFRVQQNGCGAQLAPKRFTSMCLYGVKLLYKCNHLGEYNDLVAKIEGSGTEHSHSGRVTELETMLTASCIISRHLIGQQAYEEGSLDSCAEQARNNAQVPEINTKANTVGDLSNQLAPCSGGSATFSGQSWNVPQTLEVTSSDYELLDDYTVAVNLQEESNALPQCGGFEHDFPKSVGQCGTAKECGTRNQLFIGQGGLTPSSGFGGFGSFQSSDYDETDLESAEVLCGQRCFANWQCAGFEVHDNKCFYKKDVQCGSLSDDGTCFTKRSRR